MATFLLIHGAWHGNWCWEKIVPYLDKEGHTVLSPDLPGRGIAASPHSKITLKTYVDFLKALIQDIPQQIVVVAHSFGGVIATQLANEVPNKISRIVYVCAFLPHNGHSLMDIARSVNHKNQPSAMTLDESGHTISLERSNLDYLFFNCCSPIDQQRAIERICPEPFFPMTDKVCLENKRIEKIPKIYIECSKDNALTVEAQQTMYRKYDCTSISLATDHSPFLSAPKDLLNILMT